MTLASDLDGMYAVTTTSNYDGPLRKESDGVTEISGGRTHRVDDAGCEWRSTFEWISENEVKMTSVADPTNARVDFLLTRPNGEPTSEPVTYETVLRVQRKDARVQMTGTISYGKETVILTMRKVV